MSSCFYTLNFIASFNAIFFFGTDKAFCLFLELATIGDVNLGLRSSGLSTKCLDLIQDFLAFDQLTKDSVVTIQPRGLVEANEELGSVGVGTSVGHGQNTLTSVGKLEVLVGELGTIDGFTTTSITTGEIYTKEIKEVNYRARDLVIVFPYAKPYVLPPP